MDVRLVRPTDAPLVLALTLDDSSHLVKLSTCPGESSLTRTLVQTAFPLATSGRSWIARDGCHTGLLEAQPRQYVIGWDVTRLAVHGDFDLVIPPLVGAVTEHLERRGVPRLFARCPEAASAHLRDVEFHPLAREYVLVGPACGVAEKDPLPIDSRYRMPQDAWPLHQLESTVTPSFVRQMEGLTSLDWSYKPKDSVEIVVERDSRIVAWIGWGTKPRNGVTQLSMLVDKAHKELAPSLLQYVLERASPGVRFVARVRDYQVESLNAFRDAGFDIVAEEILMVKHARVEFAREEKRRLRVANIPTAIQAFWPDLSPPHRSHHFRMRNHT